MSEKMAQTPEALNLSFLLENEREMILTVLQKDEKLRKLEDKRIRKLKNELLDMRSKGLRHPREPGDRLCPHCQRTLGLIFNRGEPCDDCNQRVCCQCRVSLARGHWRCIVCAKILELKVVTGEWFMEERSKRFSQESKPSSDIVKQIILTNPPGDSSTEHDKPQSNEKGPERFVVPKVGRSALQNVLAGARRKGMRLDKKNNRPAQKGENGLDHRPEDPRGLVPTPEPDARSICSGRSTPHFHRGSAMALESSGSPTIPNNLRSQTIGRSPTPTPSNLSAGSKDSRRPDGAESVASFHSSESVPEKMAAGNHGRDSSPPTIAVSKASLSSDRSRSEMDLSTSENEGNDDMLSVRSRSVPGELNDPELFDDDRDEDIDAVMSAHVLAMDRNVTSALSMSSLNSMMSVYSEMGDYGYASVSGEILLNISYSYKTGALNVVVKECRNLAIGDEKRQRTDPYVKAYLLPDKSRQCKRKTTIKTNTTNPVFNETLKYVMSHSQLETRTLQLSVWHNDRFGHNSFLGEVEVAFDSWEFEKQSEEWFSLQPKVESSMDSMLQYKGELTVVLKYIPAEKNLMLPLDQVQAKKGFLKSKKSSIKLPKGGMVELLIKKAENLTAVKSTGTSDPFVKGYLLPDNNKSTKHKTDVVKKSVNPQWNHTFTYCGLQPQDLHNVCLELTIWDKEPLSSNVFLGGVRLGAGTGQSYGNEVDWMDSQGEEQRLWQRMMDNPEVPQECTLMLRSSMGKRST
ncbi:synaptotagmin-like protein 5 isoform X2 [Conger conger]|uniref:synaptotagmin-like protein 5 isoform X2 n=1 Tax=Conger conger TaxID=82655 RepID=UPI002A5A2C37|nr:synaptotagmin-like protein 5 isoform X2 [Conger conger]